MNYEFLTVTRIAELVDEGKEICFTFDAKEDLDVNDEPTGWYGVKMCYDFGNGSVLFGDYGAGAIYVVPVCSSGVSIEDAIIEFCQSEGNLMIGMFDELCVDADDL